MTTWLTFIVILLTAGCSFAPGRRVPSPVQKEIVLSRDHPQDGELGARLVGIADDGTTTITVFKTGETNSAQPGAYFVSRYYGKQGLLLVSASHQSWEARFLRTWR